MLHTGGNAGAQTSKAVLKSLSDSVSEWGQSSATHVDHGTEKLGLNVSKHCGKLSSWDDGGGQVILGKWVNFTFVDLDAHGSADCLATFKLGRDNKHEHKAQSANKGHKQEKKINRNQ